MAKATGQITIIDYNDALSLTGFIGSSHPKTQQYNPDNGQYIPSWDTATAPAGVNLILTPSLFILGTSSDIISDANIQSIQWFEVNSGTETAILGSTTNYTASALNGKSPITLTVKKNVLAGLTGKDFICKIVYRDPTTLLDLVYKTSLSMNRVVNGGGIADAVAWCPDGNIFKNTSVATIRATCDFWRGSLIDSSLVGFQWFVQDPSITNLSGATLYDAGAGEGWRKLADVSNSITGTGTSSMLVYNSFVQNMSVFKVKVSDNDSTTNQVTQFYYDTVVIVDQSDLIQLSVMSSGGDIFKNGVGPTTLTAKVFRAGTDITSTFAASSYRWYKYNKLGNLVTLWGTTVDYKTGYSLVVDANDVDIKATFICELI